MKKALIALITILTMQVCKAQTIQASVQPATANSVDIVFLPSYTSAVGEYVNYLSLSIAIPTAAAGGVVPTLTMKGPFTGMTMVPAIPFSYTAGTETIYSWVYSSGPTSMTWTASTPFTGATISFSGGNTASLVRLVDFSNYVPSGGANSNTYFLIVTNKPPFDVANYAALFYAIPGVNTVGTYGNGDQFITTDALISLPVHVTSFSGYRNGSKNTLQWVIASESNNYGYEIQRSTDGIQFSKIGFVPSLTQGGNSATSLTYQFDDNSVSGAKQYYRLRQIDMDQRGKLSNIILISGAKPVKLGFGKLFPNPSSSVINVIIEAPGHQMVKLIISDINGKMVKQHIVMAGTGSNTVTEDISHLSAGTYSIKLSCAAGCETSSVKFVIQ